LGRPVGRKNHAHDGRRELRSASEQHPEKLELGRRPSRHVAFGAGIHFCLGHQLARIEGKCALQALFKRWPKLELVIESRRSTCRAFAVQGDKASARRVCSWPNFFAMLAPPPRIRAKGLRREHAFVGPRVLVILVVGLIAGWLAGKVVRGNGFGLVGDAAIGIVGALIGDWLLHRLGIHFVSGIIGLTINATIGAIVLLLALRVTGASGWGGR
jgi:uncharacterized membrane protein YeaQ/YmgE (transglycosylase-associated protein family)